MRAQCAPSTREPLFLRERGGLPKRAPHFISSFTEKENRTSAQQGAGAKEVGPHGLGAQLPLPLPSG